MVEGTYNFKLTTDWNCFVFSFRIEKGDIHIGREVSSFKAWSEIRVPRTKMSVFCLKPEKDQHVESVLIDV